MNQSKGNIQSKFLKLVVGYSLLTGAVFFNQTASAQKYEKWVAPAEAIAQKNPLDGNKEVLADARKLYVSMCTPCHGEKGKGDGPAAAALNPKPADHSSKSVQAETDGSLFYKMTTGRGPMQSFRTKLTDAQRWSLVNYIRTLKK
jgi:mono/diheme cytochrome c family protein